MENISISLIIGISSSLVATALFIGISEFIRKIILPWYADMIYRGVRIDGKWELIESQGKQWDMKDNSMSLFLKQSGEKVSGTYTHKSEDEVYEYVLEGRIRDMYFLATAVPKSNRSIDGISFLLHINYVNSKLNMTGGIMARKSPGEVESYKEMKFIWKNS